MQKADDRTRVKILTAVAMMQHPGVDIDTARRLAEEGRVEPVGQNTDPVLAYINHGRWVADCATPECFGAELVGGPTMVCASCGRESTVKYPAPKTREKIEAALDVRLTANRNWYPEETVAELVAQNIDHGILPDDMKVN